MRQDSLACKQKDVRVKSRKCSSTLSHHLIGNFPCLEALEVLEKQRREPSRQISWNILERPRGYITFNDALERDNERKRCIVQRLLEISHGLEHMRRSESDHKGG